MQIRANVHNPNLGLPYGEIRSVRLSIADTFFTIPARLRVGTKLVEGYVTHDEAVGGYGTFYFTPNADPETCRLCDWGAGCRADYCAKCHRPGGACWRVWGLPVRGVAAVCKKCRKAGGDDGNA